MGLIPEAYDVHTIVTKHGERHRERPVSKAKKRCAQDRLNRQALHPYTTLVIKPLCSDPADKHVAETDERGTYQESCKQSEQCLAPAGALPPHIQDEENEEAECG